VPFIHVLTADCVWIGIPAYHFSTRNQNIAYWSDDCWMSDFECKELLNIPESFVL
jgi:hypothetical protein